MLDVNFTYIKEELMIKRGFIFMVLLLSLGIISGCSNAPIEKQETVNHSDVSDEQKKHITNDLDFEEIYPNKEIRQYAKKMIGTRASDFTVVNLNGEEVQLNQLKGENIILELASTSCTACIESYPAINAFKQNLNGEVKVLTVFANDSKEEVEHFFKNNQYERDEEVTYGDGMNTIFIDYDVKYTPTFLFIDKDGYIQYVYIGGDIDETTLSQMSDLIFGTTLTEHYNTSESIPIEIPSTDNSHSYTNKK